MNKSLAEILKAIVCMAVLVVVFLPVHSATPFTEIYIEEETGLTIFYPIVQYYPHDMHSEISFGVLNSTGDVQDNNSVTCYFWLENNEGSKIAIQEELNFSDNYFYYELTEEDSAEKGSYNYFVYCASELEKGAVSDSISITGAGKEPSLSNILAYLLPIAFLFVMFGLFFGFSFKFENIISKIFSINMTYFLGVAIFGGLWLFTYWFADFIVIEAVFYLMFIGLTICFVPFVTLSIIYCFMYIFTDRRVAKLIFEGDFSDEIVENEKNPFLSYMLRKNIEKRRKNDKIK